MATLWPFSRKESTKNKDQTNDLAMSLQIGAELASEYSSTQQNADLKYFADVLAANPLVHACISEIAMSVGAIDYRPVIARGGTEEDFRGPFAWLLYTSDAADDLPCVDYGSRRIIAKKKHHQKLDPSHRQLHA